MIFLFHTHLLRLLLMKLYLEMFYLHFTFYLLQSPIMFYFATLLQKATIIIPHFKEITAVDDSTSHMNLLRESIFSNCINSSNHVLTINEDYCYHVL